MKYRELPNYEYQLEEEYTYLNGTIYPLTRIETDYIIVHEIGVITMKKGYAWDGATWGLDKYEKFRPTIIRASLVHDAYCQLIAEGYLPIQFRLEADRIFKEICRADGMSKFRNWYTYLAIRTFVKLKYGRRF